MGVLAAGIMVKIGDPLGLAELLAPLTIDEFFDEHFEKKQLHIQRDQPNFYNSIFSLYDIEPTARRCIEMDGEFMLKRDGNDMRNAEHAPPDCFVGYLLGGSYVLNHADLYHQELAQLCADLRDKLVHVYANLYLTPPRSQAVKAHTDDQDVFILQVAGTKNWILYEAPTQLPYTHEMTGKTGSIRAVTEEMKLRKLQEVSLVAGDLLYLPRGMMHEASTGNSELSLHLTLTCPSHDFTWAKFGAHAVTQLLMDQQGAMRSMVPTETSIMTPEQNTSQADHMMNAVLDAIKSNLTIEFAQQVFGTKMAIHNQPQDLVASQERYSTTTLLPRQVSASSQIRLNRGMQMGFEDPDKKAELCKLIIRNKGRTLEQAVDRQHISIYHAVAATKGEPFRVDELPGDGYSQICVCKLLLRQEVLEIFEEGQVKGQLKGSKGSGRATQGKGKSIKGMSAIQEDDQGELLYSG